MAHGVEFGLYELIRGTTGVDPETVTGRARRAEQAGFESVWVGDHIAMPPDAGGQRPRLEVVAALSYLAAATERIRLGFGVIVLPQRQPVLLAKQLATLDVLSGGRVLCGIGVGYVEPELQALGASQCRVQAGGLCGQHVEGFVQVVVARAAADLVVSGQLRDAGAVQQPTDHHDGVVEAAQHAGTSAGAPQAPLGVQQ